MMGRLKLSRYQHIIKSERERDGIAMDLIERLRELAAARTISIVKGVVIVVMVLLGVLLLRTNPSTTVAILHQISQ